MSYTEGSCQFSKEYFHAVFFGRFIKNKAARKYIITIQED
jgi:hypothetical protein